MVRISFQKQLIVAFVLLAPCVVLAETHPFSVHDILAMERVYDPQISPDGDKIAFLLSKTNLEKNKSDKDIWMVNADGTGLKQLTRVLTRFEG